MPIEIKELIIRATVSEKLPKTESGTGTGVDHNDRTTLIAECVEQVMEILKAQTER